jgi:hypothetical protein
VLWPQPQPSYVETVQRQQQKRRGRKAAFVGADFYSSGTKRNPRMMNGYPRNKIEWSGAKRKSVSTNAIGLRQEFVSPEQI